MPNSSRSIIQEVRFSEIECYGVSLSIKREDLIHPHISGNKYRKLKYNILKAKDLGQDTLLTFGGAYSNHIAAVAAVGQLYGLKTKGVIRGDELGNDLKETLCQNTTLRFAHECGMKFKFVSRGDYREKTSEAFTDSLKQEFGNYYLIPEGGTNELAVKGCEEIVNKETEKFNYICVAVGTGGTISGLINSVKEAQKVIGFPALKGDFLKGEIEKYVRRDDNWMLNTEYHFGGYGKVTTELIKCINKFKEETKISLDPIYTGKMIYGIVELVKSGFFKKGTNILAIHTGGLQGIEGMNTILRKKNSLIIK
tara:strand:- start:1036 stop:1965 length:930 start_codon:yes stop_codon:yes gene_type:complete